MHRGQPMRAAGGRPNRAGAFGTSQQDPFLARLERTEAYESMPAQPAGATMSKAEALKRAAVNNPITLDNWASRSKAIGKLHVQNENFEKSRHAAAMAREGGVGGQMSAQAAAARNLAGQGQTLDREMEQMQLHEQQQQQMRMQQQQQMQQQQMMQQ